MSTKFKKFLSLSTSHKRRRLSAIRVNRNDSEAIVQESGSSTSTSEETSENEPLQISALNPALSACGIHLQNRYAEQSSDNDEETEPSDSSEENVEAGEGGEQEGNEEETDDAEGNKEVQDGGGNGIEVEDGDIAHDLEEENNSDRSTSSSEDENVYVNEPENVADVSKRILKNAFLAANLKHKQGNLLLQTLREFPFNLNYLPKDARTLLHTPIVVANRYVQQLAEGEYLHIGFKCTLTKKLESLPDDMLPEVVEIDFSTDGAKVHQNGTDQFWPIQYRIYNIADKRPMIAGVFKGKHKPSNPFNFFDQFVEEIMGIREEGGILIRNRQLPLIIRCFIADAPARAFVLNHYGHTAPNACSKCKVEGYRCEEPGFRGTMIFKGTRHPPRTDEEYRNIIDEDHHKGRSPLAPVVELVMRVPFESLHLVYLGNVKKVLSAHIQGKYGRQRLNARKLDILDSRMTLLKMYCPSEFNRRPNKLTMFHHFKGTEYRQLLLYTSPAILQNVFSEEYYEHFLLLHCVMRLLSFENMTQEMYAYCQESLESYVNLCEELYGEQFLSYNVHGLLHIVADVMQLGSLETFSAFCYENNIPQFRKYIRKPHLTLQQFYKRMCELNDFTFAPVDNNIEIRVSKTHVEGPLPQDTPACFCQQFKKLKVGKITFSTALRDCCCILQNLEICVIQNIIQMQENIFLIVKKFRTVTNAYDVGITSDLVGVYDCTNLSNKVEAINFTDVKGKSYRMPKWSGIQGQEECTVENEWTCVTLLTPLVLPQY